MTTNTTSAAYELVQDALLGPHDRIKILLASLPVLGKESVDLEEPCPICLMPFAAVFEEEEGDRKTEDVDPEGEGEVLGEMSKAGGVTKLEGCGHIFCRRDLTEWIRSQHGSCPTCRHTFLNIRPPSDSDDESSDGGEYIPNADDFDDEDEDAFLDVDGFTDADTDADDFPVHGMDLDVDAMWAEEAGEDCISEADAAMGFDDEDAFADEEDMEFDRGSEWGLTDGESESMSSSDGDLSLTMEDIEEASSVALETEVNVSVHEDEDINAAEEGEGLIPHDHLSESQDPK